MALQQSNSSPPPSSSVYNKNQNIVEQNDKSIDDEIIQNHSLSPAQKEDSNKTKMIEEAERYFTLCHFRRAIKAANKVILLPVKSLEPSPSLSYHEYQTCDTQDPMNVFEMKSSCHHPLLFSPPEHLLQEENSKKRAVNKDEVVQIKSNYISNNQYHHRFYLSNPLMSSNNTQNSTTRMSAIIRDRAAAILIQSSYELWKRHEKEHNQNHESEQNRQKRANEQLLKQNLSSFLQTYMKEDDGVVLVEAKGKDTMSSTTISWDLAMLWIKFNHALGYSKYVTELILQMIQALVHWERKTYNNITTIDQSQDLNFNGQRQDVIQKESNEMYGYYFKLFYFLFVQIVPYIQEVTIVKHIIDEVFFTTFISQQYATSECKNTNLSKESFHLQIKPMKDIVTLLLDEVEAIMSHLPSNTNKQKKDFDDYILPSAFRRAMEECVEYLVALEGELEEEIENDESEGEDKHNSNQFDSDIHSSIHDEYSSDLLNYDDHNKMNRFKSIKDHLLDSLWTSEDRWINRGKAVAAGFVMVGIWRKRKRLVAAGRKTGQHMLSPLGEMFDAMTTYSK